MKKFFTLLLLAFLLYGGMYLWEKYDWPNWYQHVRNAVKIGDTRQALVLPKERGGQFAKQNIISITGNCEFSPQNMEITAGERIDWYNASGKEQIISGDVFDAKIIGAGKTYTKIFNDQGTFNFMCADDNAKKGQIIVK